jgi:UMF1 family MFS transporter
LDTARKPWMTRQVLAWAMYDWANSAFATTVIAGFFPLFFKQYWSHNADPSQSTFELGMANAAASVVVAVLAPVLGAIADRTASVKRYLLVFVSLGVLMTFMLSLVGQGQWVWAAAIYALAGIGFAGGNVFYDALLMGVTPRAEFARVSSLGFSLGYLGGGALFTLNVLMTLHPDWFGLVDATQAVKVSFVSVALWWVVFSIPLFVWVDGAASNANVDTTRSAFTQIGEGLRALRATFTQLRQLRTVWLFLIAYWFYIDGVHTIIRMAVDYGLSLGFDANSLIVALLLTQFVGFPAALGFGWLGHRVGAKIGIFLGLAVYCVVVVWAYFMRDPWEFYFLAGAIGLAQGGVQALSRSLYASLIPKEQAGQFFGFFNMLGKFAAIFGPLLVGVVALTTGSTRVSILSVTVLFVIGAVLLHKVKATGLETQGSQSN